MLVCNFFPHYRKRLPEYAKQHKSSIWARLQDGILAVYENLTERNIVWTKYRECESTMLGRIFLEPPSAKKKKTH